MARKDKPIKIKRYTNSMGTSTKATYKVKRIVPIVAGIVVIVLAGFLLGKPIMNMLSAPSDPSSKPADTSSKTEVSHPQDAGQTAPDNSQSVSSESVSSENVSSGNATDTPLVVEKNRVYYYVDSAALSTAASLDGVIANAKTAGATHLVFDVKNQDGTVMYLSQNQYAMQLKSDKAYDLKAVCEKLAENDITPVARMYTFMDKLISTVERSTAVMYQGTDTRWLDSSAALGGKAWANPANKTMQEYITALTDEIMSMGVKEIIFAGFHTPTGYSLDKRDFGASMDQVLAEMKSLYRTLEGKISAKGGRCSMQVEYTALMPEGNYSHYIVHPYQIGASNVIITAKGADLDAVQVASVLETADTAEEISSATLWITDNVNAQSLPQTTDYFTK